MCEHPGKLDISFLDSVRNGEEQRIIGSDPPAMSVTIDLDECTGADPRGFSGGT
jgi:hypothetical protein